MLKFEFNWRGWYSVKYDGVIIGDIDHSSLEGKYVFEVHSGTITASQLRQIADKIDELNGDSN